VLAVVAVGDDGLARARLPFAQHMAIVEDLIGVDPEQWLPRISCPAWLVSCTPADPPKGADVPSATAAKRAAYARAEELLARPRVQDWHGALHDVPLQWPSLVAGLVRAAAEEVAAEVAPAGAGPGVPSAARGEGIRP
jgi:hypothetical protein